MINVFVYGTLKQGEPNFSIMANQETGIHTSIGKAITVNCFPLVIASKYNIPFLLDKPGHGYRINGEVYAVDERKLQALDELESHPNFYVRRLEPVTLNGKSSDSIVQAWIYLLPNWRKEFDHLPMLSDYQSTGDHGKPYVTSENCECEADLFDL